MVRAPVDMEPEFLELYEQCRPHTLLTLENLYALFQAVSYIEEHGIEGDLVQCGVWKGGSAMLCALALINHDSIDRQLYLYDTFLGMTAPTARDVDHVGRPAMPRWLRRQTPTHNKWTYSSLDEVARNLASTGYPEARIRPIQGDVKTTIPRTVPDKICLLHLDTDWYESTRHELEHLYPRLVRGGVLVVDDYGSWRGAREAVDEYFRTTAEHIFLQRIDYTGRLVVKLGDSPK